MVVQTIRAFVSSTWLDLEPERGAVERLLQRFDQVRFAGMEYFGSRDPDTRTTSLVEVDRSELYIGIFGHRYGSGITEAEYRRARERRLPCLLYFKQGDGPHIVGDDAPTLATLKAELRTAHTVTEFSSPSDLAAKLAADLHHWLFDKYITRGMTALSAPFAERIQNFLAEYIGTPDRPIPFGGRDADLARLTDWLLDPGGAAKLMLAAPAGRGKSALLVRWSMTVAADQNVAVVFFPVSIRFNTNLAQAVFPALAAKLAALHGEPLQVPADATIDLWRSLFANYLGRPLPDGRRLLIVVDGIDEAADWEAGPDLFPSILAAGTRVVVSARFLPHLDAAGWLRHVGWDSPGHALALTLPPLTAAGVADVLAHLGLELRILSTRVDVVAELHRLSAGDPLLVRLYVTALSADPGTASRLEPEDLTAIEPGLEGFFTRWWDDQRRLWHTQRPLKEPAVQALLNLLACALGPLQRADLLQLSPREANLNAWTLDDALKPVSRFVIGDGLDQGYAFSHPRLAGYFYDRLVKAGQAREQEERYVAWGRRVLADLRAERLTIADVPEYVVQYFRAHLERTGGGVAALNELVSVEWLSAWSSLDKGSFTGFLSDVRRVWQAAEHADGESVRAGKRAEFLDLQVRCALCLSSVISMAADLPPAFLKALVSRGVWTPPQGMAYASNKPMPGQRVDALLQLATAVPAAHRDPLLGAALSAARMAPDAEERDRLLLTVGGQLEEPLAALRHVSDRVLRLSAVASAAVGRPARQMDVVLGALDEAAEEPDARRRLIWLQGLGRHLPEPHRARAAALALQSVHALLDGGAGIADVLDTADAVPPAAVPRCLDAIDAAAAAEQPFLFGRLAAVAAPPHQDPVVVAALRRARSWPPGSRLEYLSHLLDAFPPDRLDALDPLVDTFPDGEQQLRARMLIALRATGADRRQRLAQVLDAVFGGRETDVPHRLLNDIASQLPPADLVDLLRYFATQPRRLQMRFLAAAGVDRWRRLEGTLIDLMLPALEREADPATRARLAADLAAYAMVGGEHNGLTRRLFAAAAGAAREVGREDERAILLMELVPLAPVEAQADILAMAQSFADARLELLVDLELTICGGPSPGLSTALVSAVERIDTAPVRAAAASWAKSLAGVDSAPDLIRVTAEGEPGQEESAAVVDEDDDRAHPPSATSTLGPERIVAISDSLEPLHGETTAPRMRKWVDDVGKDFPFLPDALFQEVLDVAGSIADSVAASIVLREIAAASGSAARRRQATAAAVSALQPLQARFFEDRLSALLEMAPDLDRARQTRVLIDALRHARDGEKGYARDTILRAIGDLRTPAPELIAFAIEESFVRPMPVPWIRRMAARLPMRLVPRVLGLALRSNSAHREATLQAFLVSVPRPPWAAVFDVVAQVPEEEIRARALVRLAAHADEVLLNRIVDALSELRTPLLRAQALGEIVPLVPAAGAEAALTMAWASLKGAADDGALVDTLMRETIGATVRGRVLETAVTTVLTMLDKHLRARTLAALAPHLPGPLLEQALKGLQILRDDAERAAALTALLASLPADGSRGPVADIAARTARGIPWPERRGMQLALLAAEASDGDCDALLSDALAAIRESPPSVRAEALVAVGGALARGSDALMAETLTLVEQLPWRTVESGTTMAPRPTALARILPHLATPLLHKAFRIGGADVASPLERIRLLNYLAGDATLLDRRRASTGGGVTDGAPVADKEVDAAIGWDGDVVERLAMLLRDGPLALTDGHLARVGLGPSYWPESDREEVAEDLLEAALRQGRFAGPPLCARLAPDLNPRQMRTALMAISELDEELRAGGVRRLAPFLTPEALPLAVSIVGTLSDPSERSATLVRLLPLLPLPLPSSVLPQIRSLADLAERAWLLRIVATRTIGPRQESLVREAIDAAAAIDTPADRARFLVDVAARLPPSLRRLAVLGLSIVGDPAHRATALIAMLPLLAAGDAEDVTAAAAVVSAEEHRTAVLYAIARFGCDALLDDCWRMTLSIPNPFRRSLVITALAPRLTPHLLPTAVEAAVGVANPSARVEALAAIAAAAPGPLPAGGLEVALADLPHVADEGYRSELARALWTHVPAAQTGVAIELVGQFRDDNCRADAVRSLLDHLPAEWLGEAKALIDSVGDLHLRATLLARFAARASPLERAVVVEEALDVARRIPDRWSRAEALRDMAGATANPDPAVLQQALRAAIAVRRPYYVASAVEELSSHFDEALVGESLTHACALDDEAERVRVVSALAPMLTPAMQTWVLNESRGWLGQIARRSLLCALAPHVAEGVWGLAIDAAAGLHEGYRGDVLINFASYAPAAILPAVMAAAGEMQSREAALKVAWGIEHALAGNPDPREAARVAVPRAVAGDDPVAGGEECSIDLVQVFGPVLTRARGETSASMPATGRHVRAPASIRATESELDCVATITSAAAALDDAGVIDALDRIGQLTAAANRVAALQALARHARPALAPQLWESLRRVHHADRYPAVLVPLAGRIAALPAPDAHKIWAEVIRALASGQRSVLLDGIRALVPVITAIGEQRELVDTAVALDQVGTWWP